MSGESAGQKVFFREAIARALADEMAADERVLILGQDVGRFGGAYREFAGLFDRFGPERVLDTPVAEAAQVGIGVGAAAAGLLPLVAITYMDFLTLALDPLVNYGAKLRYKTGGQLTASVVVKVTAGAKGQGVAHAQCLEAWLMNVPGLAVVAPSTPADAYGLLRAALRHGGPVVYVDHKRLFPTAGPLPEPLAPIPLGSAVVRRAGSDLTLTAHSYNVRLALEAADQLSHEGISVEVIDLRSLAPLDDETICTSVARTKKLVTVEEGQLPCGVGAEIAMRVQERLGPLPVARVGALPAPVSSNPVLEAYVLPDVNRVCGAVRRILGLGQAGLDLRERRS